MQLIRRAPAKINLFLRVGRRGDDGFHPLLSWMCTVGLFDTLRFQFDREAAPASPRATLGRAQELRLSLSCDDPRLPGDARNLVWRAMAAIIEARGLADATPAQADAMSRAGGAATGEHGEISPADRDVGAVSAFLEKRIPAGAGLGGGSSNAAVTLVAMNRLLGDLLTREQLAGLAASLGSDVPFFLQAPSAMCGGRGEIVHPFPPPTQARWALLVMPEIEMPTPAVYGKFDAMSLGDPEISSKPPRQVVNDGLAIWMGHVALPSEQLLPQLINELEPPAFALRPELGRLRNNIEQSLGRILRMSGSGSSLFTLFDGETHARQAAIEIAQRHHVRAAAVELAPNLDSVA